MKPPIVANNRGDVSIFTSTNKAEIYLEPIDVKNNEYEIYDSEGYSLKADTYFESGIEKVKLSLIQPFKKNEKRLIEILIHFLSEIGEIQTDVQASSLDDLIKKIIPYGLDP